MTGRGTLSSTTAITVALLSAGSTILAAQSADRLSLSQAVRRALEHDPAVRASVATGDAARAAVGEAQAGWFPSLVLAGSATQFQEPMVATPIHGFQPGQTPPFDETLLQAGVSLQYTLFDGGARSARVRGARARADAVGAGTEDASQALVAHVVRAYLGVLGGHEVLEAHDRRLAALESALGRVRQHREAGTAADIDVLRIEAAEAAARAERVRAAAGLDDAERELARLIGARPDETRASRLIPVRPAGEAIAERDALVTRALAASPALERARQEHAAARAARGMAASARWPTLALFGAYVDQGGLDAEHQLEWNVGLQLSYPVFTGGAVRKAVARADADSRGAAERIRLVEQQVARDVDRAVSAVAAARARVSSLETAVARFAEVVRIELLRLDAGTATQTDYLDAEADLLAARAALIEAEHAELAARTELARVTGELGPAWVDRQAEARP